MSECTLPRPPSYDFWGTLRFLRFGSYDQTTSLSKHEFQQARWYPSGPATLILRDTPHEIRVSALGPGATHAIASAENLLGLNDVSPTLTGHPVVERLSKRCRGVRLSKSASFSDRLIQIILQQRIEWQQAATQWRHLVRRHGSIAPCNQLRLPPASLQLRRTSLLELRRMNIAEQQGRILLEVARLADRIDTWANSSTEELRYRLQHIRGIGPWTTEMTLALYWAEADAVPTGDYALPHSVAYALEGEHRANDSRMLELLHPFRPHRGRIIRWIMGENIAPPRRSHRARKSRDFE